MWKNLVSKRENEIHGGESKTIPSAFWKILQVREKTSHFSEKNCKITFFRFVV